MLCYVMLCYVMLCYVMLCYVMLYPYRVGTGNREHGLVRCCKYVSVTSNKSLSGQRKTLIRLRALWGAGLCAPSFAAYAKRPIFECCYFIISSNR